MMATVLEFLVALFLLIGAFFALVGSIGLARLYDFYSRIHGPTKATTLGVGGMLIASAIFFSGRTEGISLHEVLVSVFLFLTAPVSAHLLTRAARHLNVENVSGIEGAGPELAAGFPEADDARSNPERASDDTYADDARSTPDRASGPTDADRDGA
jgi:multicomponent K+:H+ antiporter subunit G